MAVVSSVRRSPPRCVRWVLACVVSCSACASDARGTEHPAPRIQWLDGDLVGAAAGAQGPQLARLARGGADARLLRLDRLLDLHDAGRFTPDRVARETLWDALGGHPTGQGAAATRDAWLALLQEALALEETTSLDEEARVFLADAIQLLSVDLELPTTADDLSIQTLAYRSLALRGHARVADNARWRLYDHVFGTLTDAVESPPERRMEVAVHSLYAVQDDVAPYLDDVAPHVRPPWPTAPGLWATLEQQRAALAEHARWSSVLQARESVERDLEDTLLAVLPARRDSEWPTARRPSGTGRPESLAPVMVASDGRVTIDAGRPQATTLRVRADREDVVKACRATLVADGRGIVLVVADPMLPSPQLHALLAALTRCKVSRIELALREARVPESDGDVLVAIPVEVNRATDLGPGAQALRDARIHVHVDGRGPRVAVDGNALSERPGTPAELDALLSRLDRAYPRERVVALTIGHDIQYQQLLDLVVALGGGPVRHYQAVGWLADGDPPKDQPEASHDRLVTRRAALYVDDPQAEIEQAFPLRDGDQRRLEELARTLSRCLPELEVELPSSSRLEVALVFTEGRLSQIEPRRRRGLAKDRIVAVRECVEDEAYGFRLREHRDRVEAVIKLGANRQ